MLTYVNMILLNFVVMF